MTGFRTLDDLEVANKRVLVRADFNVPLKDGRVADATRIERTAPTLIELADKGARVVVMSHLGRPKGQAVAELSLRPVAEAMAGVLGRPVAFAASCIGAQAEEAVSALPRGGVALLENLRFHPQEEKNDGAFADRLAALGDLYVGEAFASSHRAHASVEALARRLPAAAGRLMQAEMEALSGALDNPRRPLAAVIGGAKVSSKLEVLGNLLDRTDLLIIGGAMANTFLHAQGLGVGASMCEQGMAATARKILANAAAQDCAIALPRDAQVATQLAEGVASETVAIDAVPADAMILDIGPATLADLESRLSGTRTLIWNGPLGAFETPPFDAGTSGLARIVAAMTRAGRLTSVAGGGDTVAALARAGVGGDFSYVSTAGGAFLEWLEGRKLPGVEVLRGG